MPFYDYKCKSCNHVFETFHSISESPELPCPQCNGESKKMISQTIGISFKGSGFHVTDYKSSGSSSTASSSITTASSNTASVSTTSPKEASTTTGSSSSPASSKESAAS
ncbi:MAG TPA: FmdB family transcriptional regulator [Candidatus Margulisbacteria bacterium]|nr:FmdB family transcriptional regulator [Candidatus Margulisiibacteriota bacterium]